VAARLVLFDVDGTLIDTAGAGRRAIERAVSQVFGIDGLPATTRAVEFAGRTDPVIIADVARAAGVPPSEYARRQADLERTFLAELQREMERDEPRRRVLPGVRDLLEHLAGTEAVWLGLVTGNVEAGARIKLAAFDLNRFFPDGGFSSDHPDRREIARIACAKLSARAGIAFAPVQVTVVGDTAHDVDCARANGYRSVAVDGGWVPRDSLARAGPDHLLDSLADRDRALAALGLG
jgi:phosphoglycolate phosphatase-like HAD superfamily hydrolase